MVARTVVQPEKAAANDDGTAIVIGGTYGDVRSQTTLGNKANNGVVLYVASNTDLGNGGGIGVWGVSDWNIGVRGTSISSQGVYGSSSYAEGVYGSSNAGPGVYGIGSTGIRGISSGGEGVYGSSTTGPGVYGTSDSFSFAAIEGLGPTGVRGSSASGTGVIGQSNNGRGVHAKSITWEGLYAESETSQAVVGYSSSATAIIGHSGGGSSGVLGHSGIDAVPTPKVRTGVYGHAAQGTSARGVWGVSPAGIGVQGTSTSGYAGYFSGKVFSNKFYELAEVGNPPAPDKNRARLFIRDNGSGKTQLCVRFHTGAIKVLATQP